MTVARDQCFAKRSDGQQCQAMAIEFGRVCLVHGGSAPQVQIVAQRLRLQFAIWCAAEDWHAGQDTEAGFDLLCKVTAAERAVERFEAKRIEVADLRGGDHPDQGRARRVAPAAGWAAWNRPDGIGRLV